ncbi:alpha/beta fold hydrolase [Komagataeibacter kakiaceti]|uniref:alpha/beta fold hydrolase n=1 Tax=Komagataeibacter kakiaceti TaxID=943261 RepID=UPI00055642CF|nr:alpha/beta hydrolase [Komagataeibacter kakiaceti]
MPAALPIAFVHGWAFDHTFWQATRTALEPWRTHALDFGFFSARTDMTLPGQPYIGVGHSLGALWLLRHHGPLCRGLVLFNGFSRFGAAPGFPDGIPRRVIERMRQGLLRAPEGLLHSFRLRAGIESPPPRHIESTRLEAGLHALMDMDCTDDLIGATCPVQAVAGTRDAIAPPALTRASFPAGGGTSIHWLDGGHLLPLTHPETCADLIRTMSQRIPAP